MLHLSRVEFCWAPLQSTALLRNPLKCERIVIHRIEVSQEDPTYADTPADVARFFSQHPIGLKATGGAMPYPLLIDAAGTLTQTVPLRYITPHARAYNPTGIGVGCLGDFRGKPPTAAQHRALVRLVAHLLQRCTLPVTAAAGHDELSGGSADPDKECPGRHLPLDALRTAVRGALAGPTTLDLVW